MTLKLWLRLLMYTPVNFRTSGNVDKTGEVVFMGDDKYIEANSYFIWDTKNNIMLAQWRASLHPSRNNG